MPSQFLRSEGALQEGHHRLRPQGMHVRLDRRSAFPFVVWTVVGGNVPVVAGSILYTCRAFTVRLIDGFMNRCSPLLQRPPINRVTIAHIDMECARNGISLPGKSGGAATDHQG